MANMACMHGDLPMTVQKCGPAVLHGGVTPVEELLGVLPWVGAPVSKGADVRVLTGDELLRTDNEAPLPGHCRNQCLLQLRSSRQVLARPGRSLFEASSCSSCFC